MDAANSPMITPEVYTCEECGGQFEKGWDDTEAHQERVANGFAAIPNEQMATVCDDCYKAIVARNRLDTRSHFYGQPKPRGTEDPPDPRTND
jgi:hypothetical protein